MRSYAPSEGGGGETLISSLAHGLRSGDTCGVADDVKRSRAKRVVCIACVCRTRERGEGRGVAQEQL